MRESIMYVEDDESIGAEKEYNAYGMESCKNKRSIVNHDGLSNRKNNKQMFLYMVYALPHCNVCFAPSPHTQNQLVQHFCGRSVHSSISICLSCWVFSG
ncbi:hypothetical protein TNCV_443941 [Trichonephila clavipes]|nr:hypothetical protein TNCV_443941 [Trichonephila clavipes]